MAQRSRSAPLITTLSNVKSSPKWSMRGRFETKMRHTAPGPGAYPIVSQDKTTKYTTPPSFAFGSSVRDGKFGHQIPGPGQYTPFDPNMTTPKYGFGTAGRGGLGRKSNYPGPGTYEPTSGNDGPRFTAAGRRDRSSKAPATPGPGAYKPNLDAAYDAGPKWGFGSSARTGMMTMSGTPGPGTYSLGSTLGGAPHLASAPKYSMKPRRPMGKSQSGPGPGAHGGAFTQFG
jgi:hypothetical protein